MNKVSLQISLKLWQQGIEKVEWDSKLSSWIDVPTKRAKEILLGSIEFYPENELNSIVRVLQIPKDVLLNRDPLLSFKGKMVSNNLKYLIEKNLGHGGKKKLASLLDVEPGTISRWVNGSRIPEKQYQNKMVEAFSLDPTLSIETFPFFLSYSYLGQLEMREWVKQGIDALEVDYLKEYFPVLKKLLR